MSRGAGPTRASLRRLDRRSAHSPQMLLEEIDRPAPCQLRRLTGVDRGALLVGEGMVGVVAEELAGLASLLQPFLEHADRLWRVVFVFVCVLVLFWLFL